jgi:hypothetical protein
MDCKIGKVATVFLAPTIDPNVKHGHNAIAAIMAAQIPACRLDFVVFLPRESST